jgi:hypothetical protein
VLLAKYNISEVRTLVLLAKYNISEVRTITLGRDCFQPRIIFVEIGSMVLEEDVENVKVPHRLIIKTHYEKNNIYD